RMELGEHERKNVAFATRRIDERDWTALGMRRLPFATRESLEGPRHTLVELELHGFDAVESTVARADPRHAALDGNRQQQREIRDQAVRRHRVRLTQRL